MIISSGSKNLQIEYEFLGGDLGKRYLEKYHAKLHNEGLERIPALNQVSLSPEGFITCVNPISIVYGWDIQCDDLNRRCPSLPAAMAITHLDHSEMIHGSASLFEGIVADIGLVVQDYSHGNSSNHCITLNLRKQLGVVKDEKIYDRSRGQDMYIPVDSEPDVHYVTSLNNLKAVRDENSPYGINMVFRHPETVPRTTMFQGIRNRFNSLSLYIPNGDYTMPNNDDNLSEGSAILPQDYGTLRLFVCGPQGIKLGGPNLEKTLNESRLLVVKGSRYS